MFIVLATDASFLYLSDSFTNVDKAAAAAAQALNEKPPKDESLK
jgi:hypothetical protein